ncbi:Cof-type HAD-IIB family hydrolase [Corynebacterium uterequi]|uniref:HAD-superfamily hydrolase, subfamily IIB n=1 Tax=Corynebacterium uterequi TaxID=1072256 RepID=A0A0G3HLQ0_9CORY|nr:Cof-type HAD-IIB family hydrolase [Corynebacterium uterequi]AKK12057.1 HAD-superfamily hydrolase, subfamily IIB [Corynebacterium uterequi]
MTLTAPLPQGSPLLIASDIDGTLINSAGRVTERQRAIVHRLIDAGHYFALVTGRPHRWIKVILDQVRVNAPCVTSNGAVTLDVGSGTLLEAHELSPEVMRDVVARSREALADLGGMATAVERVGDPERLFDAGDYVLTPEFVSTWDEPDYTIVEEAELLSKPALKLVMRNDALTSAQMYERVARVVDPALAYVTYSMSAGLLEVSLPTVNKGAAVARVAERLGVAQENTIAFGDMANDIEMLRWAGCGVAMGNAAEVVKKAADVVTLSHDDDGQARVLEQLL